MLVQTAAGGVCSLAVQFARLAGAGTIAGTAGSVEKRDLVLSLGADHAVDYGREDWTEQVIEATGGKGADVVLESVGGEAGAQAFECLAPLGRLVMFGAASGHPMPPPDLMQLNTQGQTLSGFVGPPTARAAPRLPGKRSPATSETATSGSSDHPSRSQKRRRPIGQSRDARP
ncbi:hypothetical protein AVDCRST_MAG82-1976 [uncultured Rubrobacteraceae bacterium]|uniref:Alcohol dehydrogenase-like C-terminal domain-containing protein n=1 Tax=uncultured Rubrobacteraceae bacterium TaxID=349277 RepID=A0A6J4PZM8_9ACTN|nr:hypothetical protein AVDCRST_MAG82-1976 [uncultured Rubrobacteraceae bacterium]